MVSLRQLTLRLRKVPSLVWRGVILVVVVSASAIAWWYPVSHEWLALQLGLAVTPPQVIAAETPTIALADRVSELEQKVAEAEASVQADKTQMDSLVAQFQEASSEVTATNAELQKQTEQVQALMSQLKTGSGGSVSSSNSGSSGSTSSSNTSGKVAINTAGLTQLETLPGIGATYAQRIIDYRTKNGGFKTIDELQNVTGIGPSTFAKLKDLVEL